MENADYYVYVHKRADTGVPFYYGRGRGQRAWEAYRNPHHKNIAVKHGLIVEILQKDMTRAQANLLEISLIAQGLASGLILANMTPGGDGQDPEVSRKVGLSTYARKVGIHAPGMAQLGGKIAGCKCRDLKLGFHNPVHAGAGGRRTADLGVGAFSPEVRAKVGSSVGKITGKLPWWHDPATGQQRRAVASPGPTFIPGMGPRKAGVGAKISASKMGYKHSYETRMKMKNSALNRRST